MILGLLQARTSSSRLPGKVLKLVNGEPMLSWQIRRVSESALLDKLVVVTSTDSTDDAIESLCQSLGVSVYRGSLDDVLGRFVGAIQREQPTTVVRLTGDCPLVDPDILDDVIREHVATGADYTSNTLDHTFPDGLDVEAVQPQVLVELNSRELNSPERQHVTYGVYTRPDEFRCVSVMQNPSHGDLRWTVDSQADFDFVSEVFGSFRDDETGFRQQDILDLLARNPALIRTGADEARNEGLTKDLQGVNAHE
jgi:spore coat polysaccharide biosynthesis protein SpsF